MKKILIISTFYRPIQCVAANRINAFAKYLHEFGYDVTVLTCGYEYNVGENIEGGIRVIRLINKSKGILSPFDTHQKENKFIHYMKCLYNIGILLKLYNILSFPIGIGRDAEFIIVGCCWWSYIGKEATFIACNHIFAHRNFFK